MSAVIEVQHLHKSYGSTVAVDDVSLTVQRGEIFGRGFGLTAMRQRIEGLRGTLQVESEPGAGTAISACVPAAGVRA